MQAHTKTCCCFVWIIDVYSKVLFTIKPFSKLKWKKCNLNGSKRIKSIAKMFTKKEVNSICWKSFSIFHCLALKSLVLKQLTKHLITYRRLYIDTFFIVFVLSFSLHILSLQFDCFYLIFFFSVSNVLYALTNATANQLINVRYSSLHSPFYCE